MTNKLRFLLIILSLLGIQSGFAQLPKIHIKDTKGGTVDASTIGNEGKPFIVTFFSTTCRPCLQELIAIDEVYSDWQEETGVKAVVISVDNAQNAPRVAPLFRTRGWEYEVYLDSNEDLKRALGVTGVPFAMVIDGKGKTVYKHAGYTPGSELKLIEAVKKAQNE